MTNFAIKAYSWLQTRRNHRAEEGQTFIEYALVIALVSIVLAALLIGFGRGILEASGDAVDAFLGTSFGGGS